MSVMSYEDASAGPMKVIAATVMMFLLAACAPKTGPGSQYALLDALSEQLYQYHSCIPLGWQPVAVAGTYYPGYIASLQGYAEFLDAIWRGRIPAGDVQKPRVAPVFRVLNHLVQAGLLDRKRTSTGFDYYLTEQALQYYYASSLYQDNRGNMQYLCYSKIVPEQIIWSQRIPRPPDWVPSKAQWYRVVFRWKTSALARWASADPFLRSHSIVLSPLKSPTAARMFYLRNAWHLVNIYDGNWMLPALTDAAAWRT